jgi:hypothetical protein
MEPKPPVRVVAVTTVLPMGLVAVRTTLAVVVMVVLEQQQVGQAS